MPDAYTPKRVDNHRPLVSIELSVQTRMSSKNPVEAPTLSGYVVTLAIPYFTATQWVRLFVGGCSRQSVARVRALITSNV